jgi:hypothetical protein
MSRGLLLADKLRWWPLGGGFSPAGVPALEVLPDRARPPGSLYGAARSRAPRVEKAGRLTRERDGGAPEEGGIDPGGLEPADGAGGAPGLGLFERVGDVERRLREP